MSILAKRRSWRPAGPDYRGGAGGFHTRQRERIEPEAEARPVGKRKRQKTEVAILTPVMIECPECGAPEGLACTRAPWKASKQALKHFHHERVAGVA